MAMSVETLSALAGVLVLLIGLFLYSLVKADKVDVYSRFGELSFKDQGYVLSDTAFGKFCENKLLAGAFSGRVSSIAALFNVDLQYLQEQIEAAGLEETISAVEILIMKIMGLAGGIVIGLAAFMMKDVMVALFAFCVFTVLFLLPADKINDYIKEREEQIIHELPQFIEQVYMCIEAGSPLNEALEVVSRKTGGAIGKLFEEALMKSQYGGSLIEELYATIAKTNIEPLEEFLNDILISHQKGAPINETLRKQAKHINTIVALQNEERINKLGTKVLLLSFCFFVLPMLVIILAPSITSMLEMLG